MKRLLLVLAVLVGACNAARTLAPVQNCPVPGTSGTAWPSGCVHQVLVAGGFW